MIGDMVSLDEGARQASGLPLERWFATPGWQPVAPAPPRVGEPDDRPRLLFGDFGDAGDFAGDNPRDGRATPTLAGALLAEFRRLGTAIAVGRGERFAPRDGDGGEPEAVLDPQSLSDAEALVAWLAGGGRWPRHIVVAWTPAAGVPGAADSLRRRLHPLLALGRALARGRDRRPLSLSILTAGAHDVDGSETPDPGEAAALGAVRVLPLELPHLAVRQIDLGADAMTATGSSLARVAARVLAELEAESPPPLVALRGPVRWLPSMKPVELPGSVGTAGFRPRGTYLITGGLGGIGLAIAEHLAETEQARLVLLSRSPAPAREMWSELVRQGDPTAPEVRVAAALQRIEGWGGHVTHHVADVADPEALDAVRGTLDAGHGGLDGIIHAAGVAGGGLIEVADPSEVDRVLAAKTVGTVALAGAFADLRPDVMVLCSSLSSFVGGVGQFGYCAANAFLDSYPGSGLPLSDRTLVINWGGLLGSGMWVPREDDVGMEMSDAVQALRRALGAGLRPRVVISPVPIESARPWLPVVRRSSSADAPTDLAERLAGLWARVLGEPSFPADGDFFALGGDSLLAVELLWSVADEVGVRLPMQLLIDHPTPVAVARAVEAHHAEPAVS
jgi:phthiocerol/phenolphthiocerol synthesis type-I polyketide synthase E